jgi:hypothetical protein
MIARKFGAFFPSGSVDERHHASKLGGKPTAQRQGKRALSALRLPVLGCFARSKVSSADLHVVENTFD